VSAPIIFGITGASGAPYGVRLLQQLVAAEQSVSLIVSSHGLRLLETETTIKSLDDLRESVGGKGWDTYVKTYANEDRGAPPASGSACTRRRRG